MKQFPIIITAAAILTTAAACQRPDPKPAQTHRKPLISLATTPVKDQGKEEACWIYAYLACIETERIEQYGDSLNLSPLWLERAYLKEQARQSYLTQAQWKISMRSIGPEADRLLRKYGMVPYSNYHSANISTKALARDIYNKVEIAVRAKAQLHRLDNLVETALPHLPHNLRQGFYLYSSAVPSPKASISDGSHPSHTIPTAQPSRSNCPTTAADTSSETYPSPHCSPQSSHPSDTITPSTGREICDQ